MRMKNFIFSLLAVSAFLFSSCREEQIAFEKVSRISQAVDMVSDWCNDFCEVAFDVEACFIINDELANCSDLPKGEIYVNNDKNIYIKRIADSSFRVVLLEPYTVCVETDGDINTQGSKWTVMSTISANYAEGFLGHVFPTKLFGYGRYYNFPMTLECLGSSWRLVGEKRGKTQRSNNIVVSRTEVDGKTTLIMNGIGQNPLSSEYAYDSSENDFPAFDYYMDYKMIDIKWQKPHSRYDYRILSGELSLEVKENNGSKTLTPSAVFNDITVTVSYSGEKTTLHHADVY